MRAKWPFAFLRSRTDSLVAGLIFALTLAIFLLSPVHQITDSSYSMLLSESLLHHRSFELDRYYTIPRGQPKWFHYYFPNGDIYQLEVANGHLYYHFPPGGPVLSIPFVAVMNLLGTSAANADGTYNAQGEEKIEGIVAALLMAALVCGFFFTARLVLPLGWSVLVALGSAFATQVWSTASRAVWSDTWGTLLLGIVLLMLLSQAAGKYSLRPVLLGTLLAWLYVVRPTYSVHILAITVYFFWFYRPLFLRYAVTGAAWFAGFVCYSWRVYGRLLPSYYQPGRLHFAVVGPGLAGNLVSPARGLLIYVPAIFFVGYLLVRYRRDIAFPSLALMAVSVLPCHLVITSASLHWWGGYSFGPRFTTSLVPWFVLLTVIGIQAMLAARARHAASGPLPANRLELACGAVLLLLSIVINGLGAVDRATWMWNTRPLNVNQHSERLWDWRQPQFLAGFRHPPFPALVPALGFVRIQFAQPESEPYLWYGWSPAEQDFRWTEAKEAAVVFAVDQPRDLRLTARLFPFLVANRHRQQRLSVSLNGTVLGGFTFDEASQVERTLKLPGNLLKPQNVLTFDLPDAASPASLGPTPDDRLLGVAVYWMQFQAQTEDL